MDFIVFHTKEILALLGGITSLLALIFTFYTKIKDVKLKEQELRLKVTVDKQKELFSNKIEAYQQLYPFYILFHNEDYQLDRLTEDNDYDEEGGLIYQGSRKLEEFEIKMKIIDDIVAIMADNIFYVSKELENLYSDLYQNYHVLFNDYHNKHVYNYYASDREDEIDFNKAQKIFYDKNKDKIKRMIDLIKSDFLDLRTKYFYES